MTSAPTEEPTEAVVVTVFGHVQGVGFRYWAQAQARELGLAGYVTNLMDGRVEILAEGNPRAVAELCRRCDPDTVGVRRPGWVTSVGLRPATVRGRVGFTWQ